MQLNADVEKIKNKNHGYSSFHIQCECDNPEVFMDPPNWPKDVIFHWWHKDRKKIIPPNEGNPTSSKQNDY